MTREKKMDVSKIQGPGETVQEREHISILDVILHYNKYSTKPQVMVVVDRLPEFVYKKSGKELIASDSGFYSTMYIDGPSPGEAFGGRKFDIKLDTGETLHCNGQVWDGRPWPHMTGGQPLTELEPTVSIGVNTVAGLAKCHVYCGGLIAQALLNDWLYKNEPSYDYYKYDPRETMAWLDSHMQKHPGNKRVSAKRARTLRQRGVKIHRDAEGNRYWSQWYEQSKAAILARQAPGYKGRFHPENAL